jgi:hypothetical protein
VALPQLSVQAKAGAVIDSMLVPALIQLLEILSSEPGLEGVLCSARLPMLRVAMLGSRRVIAP